MKYVDYTKMSKKQRKTIDTKRRRMWSDIGRSNPATKIINSCKLYRRQDNFAAIRRSVYGE